jgi:hypothetical protein
MVEERSTLEVGVVGAEGMVGVSVFLGAHASPNQALVQGAGAAMSMKADAMRKHVGHEGRCRICFAATRIHYWRRFPRRPPVTASTRWRRASPAGCS